VISKITITTASAAYSSVLVPEASSSPDPRLAWPRSRPGRPRALRLLLVLLSRLDYPGVREPTTRAKSTIADAI
jgi:hypothetical protein